MVILIQLLNLLNQQISFKTFEELILFMKNNNKVGLFHAGTKQMILTKNCTELVAFHEKAYLQHFEELGEEYHLLKPWEKETYVFEKFGHKNIFGQKMN